MKIIIKPEAYYLSPAPSLTKGMMDYFYYSIDKIIDVRYDFKKIETIHVRVNRAYKGCFTCHFYISINGEEELYLSYNKHDEYMIGPYYYFDGEIDKSHYFRYGWIRNLSNQGIDMGTEKPTIKFEKRWKEIKRQKKITKDAETKAYRYKQYLILKKEFENE